MKRQAIALLTTTWLILGMASARAGQGHAAPSPATLKAVTISDPSSGRELLLRLEGECSFKAVQGTGETLFMDLKGAKVGGVAKAGQWSAGLVTGYRLLQYADAAGQPVVRVQIETKRLEPFIVLREPAGLRLVFGENLPATAASPAQSPAVPVAPAETRLPTAAQPVPAPSVSGPAKVSTISHQAGAAGETFIDVATTRSTSFRVLQLQDPARLVVDFEGAVNATRQKSYALDSPVVKSVRIGQFHEKDPAVARVVADLIGAPVFDVHAIPGGVRIELRPRSLAKTPAVGAMPAPAPGPASKPEETKPVQIAAAPVTTAASGAEPNKSTVPVPPAEAVAQKASASVPPPATVMEAPKVNYQSTLPSSESSREAAAPLATPPVRTPEALQAEKAARTLAASEARLTAAEGPAPGSGGPEAEEKPQYTGESISLNLKDVDLKDFFRLIHEISGLNIIVDPNVAGSITLVLDSVPWDQALEIVLKNNGLGKTLEGNVLRIARMETLTAEQEATMKLAAAREEMAPLVTVFRTVNYAKATTIATLLKSWSGGGALTKRGNILVDERTNTLIISDIQTQIPVIENIVSKLDKKSKQVAIEARVVLATSDFSRDLQSALSGAGISPTGHTLIGGSTGTGASATPGITFTPGTVSPAIAVGETGASGFGAIAISNATSRYILNAALAAAETRQHAKTISRPTIVTQNNVPATVQQGSQIPIQTNINLTVTTTFVNATLQLTVTPQITEDGNVFMIINVTNASPGPVIPGSQGPSINTQMANTQVRVPDGGTVVFGGITVTSRSKSAQYVPVLGTIPIIGHLFKSSNVTETDRELLFFVSPKVLPG